MKSVLSVFLLAILGFLMKLVYFPRNLLSKNEMREINNRLNSISNLS